jgi:hypothetical protein
MANARNGSKPARSSLEEQPYLGRAETRRRFALARPVPVPYQASWLAAIPRARDEVGFSPYRASAANSTKAKKRFRHRLSLPVGIVEGSDVRIDRSDFHEQAVLDAGVTRCDLGSFIEAIRDHEPVAADHFLRFTERSIGNYIATTDGSTFVR